MSLPAVPPAPPAHYAAAWCRQHEPEGCLSAAVQIPDLPITVWATTTEDPAVVQIIIDGATDGTTHEVLIRI